ncbi:response regulator [Microvirga puerhi]|uniref:response regulator n=1 Tax=Microvirga puerhi TaxID=2876078 RepID=UPI0034E2E764
MLQNQRILVVEDEAAISILLEDMVTDLGAVTVGPAGRLDQALTLALQADIDVGLLDINVDGRVVYPVADVLAFRGIPFVFSTGYGRDMLPERFSSSLVLNKPFSYAEFAEALQKALCARADIRPPAMTEIEQLGSRAGSSQAVPKIM